MSDRVRFTHLRNSKKHLLATIAYLPRLLENVHYGVAIVAPSEPCSRVSYARGRSIASTRMYTAVDVNRPDNVLWGIYYNVDVPPLPALNIIKSLGFQMLGEMREEIFIERLKVARERIKLL